MLVRLGVFVISLAHVLIAPPLAFEQGLSEGLRTERRLFHMTLLRQIRRKVRRGIFFFGRVSC
jgi:hypothetical protein